MPITTTCQQCGKLFENLSDQLAGKRIRCKACGNVLRLPAIAEAGGIVDPVPIAPVTESAGMEPAGDAPHDAFDVPTPRVDNRVVEKFQRGAKQSPISTRSPPLFVDGGVYLGGILRKLGIQTRRKAIVKWVDLMGLIVGGLVSLDGVVKVIFLVLTFVGVLVALGDPNAVGVRGDAALGIGFVILFLGLGFALALLYLISGCMLTFAAYNEITKSQYRERWAYRAVITTSILYLCLYFLIFAVQLISDASEAGVTLIGLMLLSSIPVLAILACIWRFAVDQSEKRLEQDELRYVRSRRRV